MGLKAAGEFPDPGRTGMGWRKGGVGGVGGGRDGRSAITKTHVCFGTRLMHLRCDDAYISEGSTP